MHIEAECKRCHAVYKVKEEFAGRMARCKHCGIAFRVPYRSRVMGLDEGEQVKPAGGDDERSFEEYGVALKKNDNTEPVEEKDPDAQLPPILAELWVPLAAIVIGYGVSLWLALDRVLHSHGVPAGCVLIAAMAILYLSVVIPLTIRALEGASKTVEFELSNSIWLQTTAALALPTLCGTIGMLNGGFGGTIAGVFIGLLLMIPLMMIMFRVDPVKMVQGAVLASMFYLMSLAGAWAVLAFVSLVVFPQWEMNLPWRQPPPPEVAESSPPPAPAPAPVTVAVSLPQEPSAPPPVEVAPAPEPVAEAAPEPPPVEEKPMWTPVVDPAPKRAAWPLQLNLVIDVKPPVNVIADADTSCVALFDADSARVIEVRSGRRVGLIRDRFSAIDALLSPGGKYLLARRMPKAGDVGLGRDTLEVWSSAEGRVLTQFPYTLAREAIGFADEIRLVTVDGGGGVRIWDVPSSQQLASYTIDGGGTYAISSGGKYLAAVALGKLRVHDLENGRVISESDWTGPVTPRAAKFSSDGSALAAVVGEPLSLRLIIFDMKTGSVQQDAVLPASASSTGARLEMAWLPDDQALMIGVDLIDRVSGKMYYKVIPPVTPQFSVRTRVMLSNYHVLFESLPQTAPRMSFKSTALPRGEVDMALHALRGPEWNATAAADASPTTLASAAQEADAPAPAQPIPLLQRVKEKQWNVHVVVVRQLDIATIDEQIREEERKLPEIQRRYAEAKKQSDEIESAYVTVPSVIAGQTRRQPKYSSRQIGEARVVADRIADEERKVKRKVAQLQREKTEAANTRTVAGKLEDGTIVQMECEGAAMIAITETMTPSSQWLIGGSARIVDNLLTIKPRTITPLP